MFSIDAVAVTDVISVSGDVSEETVVLRRELTDTPCRQIVK